MATQKLQLWLKCLTATKEMPQKEREPSGKKKARTEKISQKKTKQTLRGAIDSERRTHELVKNKMLLNVVRKVQNITGKTTERGSQTDRKRGGVMTGLSTACSRRDAGKRSISKIARSARVCHTPLCRTNEAVIEVDVT